MIAMLVQTQYVCSRLGQVCIGGGGGPYGLYQGSVASHLPTSSNHRGRTFASALLPLAPPTLAASARAAPSTADCAMCHSTTRASATRSAASWLALPAGGGAGAPREAPPVPGRATAAAGRGAASPAGRRGACERDARACQSLLAGAAAATACLSTGPRPYMTIGEDWGTTTLSFEMCSFSRSSPAIRDIVRRTCCIIHIQNAPAAACIICSLRWPYSHQAVGMDLTHGCANAPKPSTGATRGDLGTGVC